MLCHIVTLCPRDKGHLHCPLNHIGATLFAQQPAVLEKSFIPRKPVRVVLERNQTKAPNAASAKLALELHAVGSTKYAVTMEPTLHELAFVPAAV